MKKRKSLRAGLAAVLSLALLTSAAPLTAAAADVQAPDTTVTIFHTNDIHGKLNSLYNDDGTLSQIGMDVLAGAKEQTPNSLLVDSGDVSQGQLITTQSKGAFAFEIMSAAGYDVMTLGNHEFDYGVDQLLENVADATFPVLSANAQRDGKLLLEGVQQGIDGYDGNGASYIEEVDGKKIGFFGITTTETAYKTNPNNLGGTTFDDEVKTAQAQADALEAAGADAVVAILHVGIDRSSDPTSQKIAAETTGIDVILDGHSHSVDNEQVTNADGEPVYINQTGTTAANVGVIELNFDAQGALTVSSENLDPAAFGAEYTADPDITALYDARDAELEPLRQTVVGTTENSLYGGSYEGKNVCRVDETNLGSLIADAMVDKAEELVAGRSEYENLPIVAIENGGGVRTTLPTGDITVADVNSVLPFGNTLAVKEVTPKVLYEALEVGLAAVYEDGLTSALGGYPQVGGMRFTYDLANEPFDADTGAVGNRVTEIVLVNPDGTDGAVLDRNDDTTPLLLASNDFLIAGGDGFTMLTGLPAVAETEGLDAIVQDYITQLTEAGGGSFRYDSTGRSTVLYYGQPLPTYTGSIAVTQNDLPLANSTVLVSIDGGEAYPLTTNGGGILRIEKMAAGGHAVEVFAPDGTKLLDECTNSFLDLNCEARLPFYCDTTATVSIEEGRSYFALVTVDADAEFSYTSGNGDVLATLARAPQQNPDGTVSYLLGFEALQPGSAGLYLTIDGTTYKLYTVNVEVMYDRAA